ncbi:hypothetical protein [Rhodococcus sp. RDE2]|uniref:hypothetical protein n=1 Tax=Rhodococcus sp. RDE2 TaxID=2885078 RepID=UPI001E4D9181|nr:hypothetical protein [Rhodococcus sp. RDE2]
MMEQLMWAGQASLERLLEFLATQSDQVLKEFGLDPSLSSNISNSDRRRLRRRARAINPRLTDDLTRILYLLEQAGDMDSRAVYEGSGLGELEVLLERGLMSLAPDGFDLGDGVDAHPKVYTAALRALLTDHSVHPLFDTTMSERVSALVESGRIRPSPLVVKHAGVAAAGTGLIQRLPVFPYAALDDVLDARDQLREPLSSYRKGMAEYAKKLGASPFDNDRLRAEIDDLWHDEVEIHLRNLYESLSATKLVFNAAKDALANTRAVVSGSIAAASSICMGVADLTALTVAAVPSVAGVAATALKSKDIANETARNDQFYYLLELNRRYRPR